MSYDNGYVKEVIVELKPVQRERYVDYELTIKIRHSNKNTLSKMIQPLLRAISEELKEKENDPRSIRQSK